MNQRHAYNQGFTLIELSVVLVIIGLIIGGVLVGQDLIRAAADRAQIAQIEKFNTAVGTFQAKYGGIPGDLSLSLANQFGFYTHSSCTGITGQRDGNGLIDGYSVVGSQLAALMGENALFWTDLTTSGLTDFNSVPPPSMFLNCVTSIDTTTPNVLLPPGKIGYNTVLHVYEIRGQNWFMLADITQFSSATSNVSATVSIPVSEASNIDQKIDDGLPTKGSVIAFYVNGSKTAVTPSPNSPVDTGTTCINTTTNTYSSSVNNGSGPNCALSFRMQGAAR
jgi:prepilin-type N-terminal cleavage/methylation domain-containing protein